MAFKLQLSSEVIRNDNEYKPDNYPIIIRQLSPVVVTGPAIWTGSVNNYAANGGVRPYTLSAPVGNCGIQEVTAVDACKNKGTLSVRMPTGYYAQTIEYDSGFPWGYEYSFIGLGSCGDFYGFGGNANCTEYYRVLGNSSGVGYGVSCYTMPDKFKVLVAKWGITCTTNLNINFIIKYTWTCL